MLPLPRPRRVQLRDEYGLVSVRRKPLRVAVDARSLLCKAPRGEGKSLLRLYQTLCAQRPDFEVVLFGDSSAADFEGHLPAGCRMVRMPACGNRANAWENLLFPMGARLAGCRVMHCTSSGAPRRTLMPMVMTVHDLIPILFDDGQSAAAQALFSRRLMHGLRQARTVMAVSEHTRTDLLRLYPGVPKRPCVVHWGADPLAISVAANSGEPTVLVFGGEARRKNTEYTLDRFIGAARRVPGLRLQMVGIASARQRTLLERQVQVAGLTDRVEMPGFVSEEALTRLMRGSTLMLYLSLYEGFGVPLLEAIAHGLPVVASDRTSIPEVLAGAPGCHDLADPQAIEDAIVALASDAGARQRYGAAQATILANFDWSVAARRLSAALEDAARSDTPGTPAFPRHLIASRQSSSVPEQGEPT